MYLIAYMGIYDHSIMRVSVLHAKGTAPIIII